ncbi:MAG: ATP synthase F1 subunit epsilon [Solirubrobacterales bacterium]|nr:ATP synthase F1 subunit epsilon [Solirubrobacterales bacterium]OJU94244.1 MAG: ATP synthase F1 subunit epsilon [Solirubrobacterales bacterium 67-14]
MSGESTFTVEVLTPEGEVFNGEVVQLSTRTVTGEIGILARHVPVLAALKPTLLRLKVSDSETKEWAQSHGMLQVFANNAQVLLEEAIEPSRLDTAALEEQKTDAEARLADDSTGEAAREVAERDLERVEAFLSIANS